MTSTTTTHTPVACSLSASGYQDRLAAMRRLAGRALTARGVVPGGRLLTFLADDDVERELRAIIAAEAECCPFLLFRLERDGDALRLRITGPETAATIIEELFAPTA